MSEQARIETAIDTTIDNCEVLRARLAKYEDADGKPITTIAEQAREISSINALADQWAEKNQRLSAELAALKAQPSRVVLPEPMRRGDEGGLGEYGAAMIRGYNACLREVTRLNQPASAGDERAAFEASFENMFYSACFERHESGEYAGRGLQGAWLGWKARASLSANHSEQVRGEWMVSLMGPDEVVRIQRKDGKWCGVTHLSESPRDRLLYEFLRTIAAPSAGSQKEQGE